MSSIIIDIHLSMKTLIYGLTLKLSSSDSSFMRNNPLRHKKLFEHDLEILVKSFISYNHSIKYLIFICLPSLGF